MKKIDKKELSYNNEKQLENLIQNKKTDSLNPDNLLSTITNIYKKEFQHLLKKL